MSVHLEGSNSSPEVFTTKRIFCLWTHIIIPALSPMFYWTQNQPFHTLPCLQNIYIESIQCLSLISLPADLFELEHNIQIIISFCYFFLWCMQICNLQNFIFLYFKWYYISLLELSTKILILNSFSFMQRSIQNELW